MRAINSEKFRRLCGQALTKQNYFWTKPIRKKWTWSIFTFLSEMKCNKSNKKWPGNLPQCPPGHQTTLKYWPHPILPRPHPKNLNLSDLPFMSNLLKIIGELDSPLHPLKCTLVQKSENWFFKETIYFISNNEIRTMNIQSQNLKIKGVLGIFISAWLLVTDLIGTFNADSRKSVSKFSGFFSWKIYTMERGFCTQVKLGKNKTNQNSRLK